MKIILVAGARPNFMKIALIICAIKSFNQINHTNQRNQINQRNQTNQTNQRNQIDYLLIHTGQHYDYEMSKVFFEDLDLPEPDIYLGVGSGTHAEQTGKVMIEFEKVLFNEKPDLVVVVGDVNSTLACALAASKIDYSNRPLIAHVEAGLRSFDRAMPEEINRLLTDQISDFLFTPSPDANENLKKEGVSEDKIFLVGNVMVDSLLYNLEKAKISQILEKLGLIRNPHSAISNPQSVNPYALLTLHRPSNVDDKDSFLRIINALIEISKRIPIIFPIHPRTRKQIESFGFQKYFSFLELNSTNQTNQTNDRNRIKQINQINQKDQTDHKVNKQA